MAKESGRVIGETIERGGNYPFGRLVRESGVERGRAADGRDVCVDDGTGAGWKK